MIMTTDVNVNCLTIDLLLKKVTIIKILKGSQNRKFKRKLKQKYQKQTKNLERNQNENFKRKPKQKFQNKIKNFGRKANSVLKETKNFRRKSNILGTKQNKIFGGNQNEHFRRNPKNSGGKQQFQTEIIIFGKKYFWRETKKN